MFVGSSVALITPMSGDGAIDFVAWRRLLDLHLESGTHAVVVGGTTGESTALTEDELHALIVAAREQLRGRIKVIVGAGTSSTAGTLDRVRAFGSLGIDAVLVVTPAYVKPTQEGLYRHFEAVAAASPVPVILYNVPGRTAVDLLPETVARLAHLPRIVALKEAVAGAERVRAVCAAAPTITVLSGDDPTACEALLAGARGVISVTANVAPRAMADLVRFAVAGDSAQARATDSGLAALHRALFIEPNPIPVKWALARLGLASPTLRLPLTPLVSSHGLVLESALAAAGLLAAQ